MAKGVSLLLLACLLVSCVAGFSENEIKTERGRVIELFNHGYTKYMNHAFPYDELCPLSCTGRNTLGNYSLTLIDSLDMLAIIGDIPEFTKQIQWIQTEDFSFNINVNVSSFETNIRVLGGLLSAHLLAEDLLEGYPWEKEPLLTKAIELGDILAKAFNTPTGIPYGTVNLADGGSVPPNESKITSLATAGTFLIEFGILSKLTNNPTYENLARDSLYAIWNFRSEIGLFGNHIDITNGRWTSTESSIGGNSDSFYEYLLKSSILFGDVKLRKIFDLSYEAIMKYLYRKPWYPNVNMQTGKMTTATFESLQGFWPGLQVILGEIEPAAETMHAFQSIWREFGFVPELFDLSRDAVVVHREQYPLRPEMAESLYYLYSATRDPIWLQYGREMINSIEKHAKVPCGFAALENIKTKELRDHMDSFFLSETCKYLFLLFTPHHPIATSQKYIFNTEGHPFPIRSEWLTNSNFNSNPSYHEMEFPGCSAPTLPQMLSHGDFQPITHFRKRAEDLQAWKKLHQGEDTQEDTDTSTTESSNDNEAKPSSLGEKTTKENEIGELDGLVVVEVVHPEEVIGEQQVVFLSHFGMQFIPKGGITGTVQLANPTNACEKIENNLEGKIALVDRGICEFVQKVRNCQDAGAIAVIVANNEPGENSQRISMSGAAEEITIPSVFISHAFGEIIIPYIDDLHVRIHQDDVDALNTPVIINLAELDLQDSESTLEYIDAIIKSVGVDNSEALSRQLSELLASIKLPEDDEEEIYFDGELSAESGKIVGKQMQACVDGNC